jgi:hypothetical protein
VRDVGGHEVTLQPYVHSIRFHLKLSVCCCSLVLRVPVAVLRGHGAGRMESRNCRTGFGGTGEARTVPRSASRTAAGVCRSDSPSANRNTVDSAYAAGRTAGRPGGGAER